MTHYFTDTHCHLDFPVFDDDRDVIFSRCVDNNIMSIVVPGITAEFWPRVLALCSRTNKDHLNPNRPQLYPALGLHPCFLQQHQENDLQLLQKLCKEHIIHAIGEIGLDYYLKTLDRERQQFYFIKQLEIASDFNLPVLIHARKSHEEVLKHLKSFTGIKGIIHAYSGSYEQAKEFIKLGFKLGFGGAFTYPRAKKLRSLVEKLPLEAWVVETDAPDMSPVGHYQQRNSPEYLSEITLELVLLTEGMFLKQQVYEQLEKNTRFIFPAINNVKNKPKPKPKPSRMY